MPALCPVAATFKGYLEVIDGYNAVDHYKVDSILIVLQNLGAF